MNESGIFPTFQGKKEEAGCFFDGWLFKEKEGGK